MDAQIGNPARGVRLILQCRLHSRDWVHVCVCYALCVVCLSAFA